MTFRTGSNETSELTDVQLHGQFKMYVAALRIAERFGCDAIGIQYQQGLKDMAPASDLVEASSTTLRDRRFITLTRARSSIPGRPCRTSTR
jgi:cell division FtsZ-interacting protein ZapD